MDRKTAHYGHFGVRLRGEIHQNENRPEKVFALHTKSEIRGIDLRWQRAP
jgi:hypothetical protein